jgi:aspartate/tyrosine/aromatic aminotransferase
MNMWNEHRDYLKSLLHEHTETKNKEIALLRAQTEILQKELEGSRSLNEANLQNVITSIEKQLGLFKERELFTVAQLLELEEKFNIYKEEKERMILLLKEEINEVKGHNSLIGKLKADGK